MNSNLQMGKIEKAFYADGYQLGMGAVKAGMSKSSLYAAIKEMYRSIDELLNSLFDFAQQQEQPIECKKGCEWCCHQPVFAMDYELKFLDNYLKEEFSNEEQKEVKIRAQKKQQQLTTLEKETLLNSKFPCPLLDNGVCMAHEARPMACRIYLSSNVKTCLKFYNTPEDKTNYPALLEFPMRAGRMMNEGFKAALKTKGIIAKEFRIEEKILN